MRQSYFRASLLWSSGILAVIGILGFIIQGATTGNHLFGLFYVDTSFNTIYTAAGVIGLAVAFTSDRMIRAYFRLAAIVFAVWAVIGLFVGSGQVLGFINNNGWDVALNAIVALAAAGFGWSEATAMERDSVSTPSRNEAVGFGEFQDRHRDR